MKTIYFALLALLLAFMAGPNCSGFKANRGNIVASQGGPQDTAWVIPPINLIPGGQFDLKTTLPPQTPSGGVFSLAVNSAPLPEGVTLSPDGILTAAADTQPTTVTNVIFNYDY